MSGDWWTVYGQSCGQVDSHGDWGGAHDWVPCSHARFLQVEQEEFLQVEEEEWINNTTFCVGSDSVCTVSQTSGPSYDLIGSLENSLETRKKSFQPLAFLFSGQSQPRQGGPIYNRLRNLRLLRLLIDKSQANISLSSRWSISSSSESTALCVVVYSPVEVQVSVNTSYLVLITNYHIK